MQCGRLPPTRDLRSRGLQGLERRRVWLLKLFRLTWIDEAFGGPSR
jgi:hypothetical protein